ncbi:MAG: HDOD domain-containing protein [Burkholderiaceae bacterium]|nr:MAG: HDOD domain-containing protein [Burkholderiaceae bacterium]
MTAATLSPQTVDEPGKRKARLLARIDNSRSLPTLGASIARIVQTASSDDEATNKLAGLVLSDAGLTQKVLHLANTVYFRAGNQIPVTTVSRAILVLGFETVKTSALALLLVEKLGNAAQAQQVKRELLRGLMASCAGREAIAGNKFADAEEAVVAALFRNLGQVLVATHDYELYEEIRKLAQQAGITDNQAAMRMLGFDYYNLTCQVMQQWSLPDTLIGALAPLPGDKLKPPGTRSEWVQQVSCFSAEIANACNLGNEESQRRSLALCRQRFGAALDIKEARFSAMVERVVKECQVLMRTVGVTLEASNGLTITTTIVRPDDTSNVTTEGVRTEPTEAGADGMIDGLPSELLMQDADTHTPEPKNFLPSGKPENARELLLSSLQEVMQTLATSRPSINQVVMMVLEALYRSMGFRLAVVCLRQPQLTPSGAIQMRARTALGERADMLTREFAFEANGGQDLFSLALKNDVDLMISDASDAKIKLLLPAWQRALLPDARSFILLPLVVNKKPIGLFYADRNKTTPEGICAEETALIKSLKSQVLATLRQ